MASQSYRDFFKYILVGDSGVGKSHLVHTFANRPPPTKVTCTIESEIEYITLNKSRYKLHLWDAAGSERYREMFDAFYPKCYGIIIVYDVTNKETFVNVQTWVERIMKTADPNVCILLLGNKSDLDERQVTFEEAKDYADQNNMLFAETSALNAFSVHEVFSTLTIEVHKKRPIFMPKEKWADAKQVVSCSSCHSAFSFWNWWYHCRKCGKVFDSKCSNYFVGHPKYSFENEKQIRLCQKCHSYLKEDEEEEESTLDTENSVQVFSHQIINDISKATELAVGSSLEEFLEAKAHVQADSIKKDIIDKGDQVLNNQITIANGTLAVRVLGDALVQAPKIIRSVGNTALQNFPLELTWAASAGVLVGECLYNFCRLLTENITWKMFTKKVCVSLGSAALCAAGSTVGAMIGGAIGTLICPVIGTTIVGFLGELTGGFVAGLIGTPMLESFASKYVDDIVEMQQITDKKVREIYLGALKKFDLNEDATDEDLREKKRTYQLRYHPDKNRDKEEWAQKLFVEYTTAYHIITNYRKAHDLSKIDNA